MVNEATTTVQMDGEGRITVPKSTRKALDVDDEAADLELDIRVLQRRGAADE